MSTKKNIDRLFQEKFKDFEVTPNYAVWDRINEKLHPKKKKRRVIPIWWRLGGVAAILLLMFTIGPLLFDSKADDNHPVVEMNSDEIKEDPNVDIKTNAVVSKTADSNTVTAEDHSNITNSENSSTVGLNKKSGDEVDTDKNSKYHLNPHFSPENTVVKSADNNTSKSSTTDTFNVLVNNSDLLQKEKVAIADNGSTSSKTKEKRVTPKSQSELDRIITSTSQSDDTAVSNNTQKNPTKAKRANNNADVEALVSKNENKPSIEDAIAEAYPTNEKEKEETEELSRWSIAPNVAPVYFSSFGEGSPIHSQFNKNTKTGDINMSYGINGGYAINNRLKLRAGVKRVDLSYSTNDVLAFNSSDALARSMTTSEIDNIALKQNSQSITLMSSETMNNLSTPEVINTGLDGSINQRLGFIEVPLELEYRLVDKKLGVNVIGGFSTFFLSENEISADVNGANTSIGEATNINSTSYSANFGLGIDYSISKRLKANLEPTFKYQINTFNNTFGDFQPFFIGVYTGLSFKF